MKTCTLIFIITLLGTVLLTAGLSQENEFSVSDPVLLTSAGQSADILMARILVQKAGLDFIMDKTAAVQKLDSVNSVIVVTGGSTKGLGAAKIDKEGEYQRVETLLTAAEKIEIPVIVMHLGGKSRRGALSDYFNKLSAEGADYLIVVEGGDEDGFFSTIATEKKITLDKVDKIANVRNILEKIYISKQEVEDE